VTLPKFGIRIALCTIRVCRKRRRKSSRRLTRRTSCCSRVRLRARRRHHRRRELAETVYPPPVYKVSVERRSAPRGASWKSVVVVLLFLAVFAGTTKVLLDRRTKAQPQVEAEPAPAEVATRPAESSTRSEATRKPGRADSTVEEEPAVASDTTSSAPTPALATVTVLIDPESGLLAKPDCPVRSRMTYPSGNQPSAYCNLNHAPPPKESELKSIKEKILR
jgi:hypothetical protein